MLEQLLGTTLLCCIITACFYIAFYKIACKFNINDFENDEETIKNLLKKPNNIMIGNLPVGEDFPMRVLSEIANARFLSK